MENAPLWTKTVVLPEGLLTDLETFIHHPETRQKDVLWEQNLDVEPNLFLNVTVKHDIFEGTVINLSLVEPQAYRYLAGESRSLGRAQDVLGDYDVVWNESTYRLRLQPASSA